LITLYPTEWKQVATNPPITFGLKLDINSTEVLSPVQYNKTTKNYELISKGYAREDLIADLTEKDRLVMNFLNDYKISKFSNKARESQIQKIGEALTSAGSCKTREAALDKVISDIKNDMHKNGRRQESRMLGTSKLEQFITLYQDGGINQKIEKPRNK
jgi:hypothetical protein